MTKRTLTHALTRPSLWLLVAAGAALAATVTVTGGLILIGTGLLNTLRIATKSGLEAKLEFADQKKARGVQRRLRMRERRALDAVLDYANRLKEHTHETKLSSETSDQAWEIVQKAGGKDCTQALEQFLEGLPPVETSDDTPLLPGLMEAPSETLNERIAQDLERQRKINRELDSI